MCATAPTAAIRNVVRCVERSNLEVQDLVVQPYASALACLVPDERELGVALVDIGGGTCDIAVYADGALVYTAVIPLGGSHVTSDIARGLSTPLAAAERIKVCTAALWPAALWLMRKSRSRALAKTRAVTPCT